MKKNILAAALSGVAALQSLQAVPIGTVNYNDTITAIYGTDNPDGSWVSATSGSVEVGVRFRERQTANMPNNGAGVFQFGLGTVVNFDFSINSGSTELQNYTYLLGLDIDPSAGVTFMPFTFDPTLVFGDNSYGNSGTLNSGGFEGAYFLFANTQFIAQNSQQLASFGINTSAPGTYDIFLAAYSKTNPGTVVAQTEARVQIGSSVPDGGMTLTLLGLSLGGLMLGRRALQLA